GRGRVLVRALVDPPVRLLDQLVDARLVALAAGRPLAERRRGEPGGDLARLRAAHPVRDREERRLDDVRVLVLPPPTAGVGRARVAADVHPSNLSSVSPTRTTSPGSSRRGRVSFVPFT